MNGKFLEEPSFEAYVKDYVYTVEESRHLLNMEIKKNNYYYGPYPKEIVYAFDGGYFFVKGEFKTNLQMDGYYVSKEGEVSPLNMKKSITMEQYNNRTRKAP